MKSASLLFVCVFSLIASASGWLTRTENDGSVIFYPSRQITIDDNNALPFMREIGSQIGIGTGEIQPLDKHILPNGWVRNFTENYAGLPVVGSRIAVAAGKNNKLIQIVVRWTNHFPESGTPSISRTSIPTLLGIKNEQIENTRLVWFITGNDARLTYEVLYKTAPASAPITYISAHTGEIIDSWNRVNFARVYGDVGIRYLPRYYNDSLAEGAFQNGNISIFYVYSGQTDTAGYYDISVWFIGAHNLRSRLDGNWVDVNFQEGTDAQYSADVYPDSEYDWVWDTTDAHIDELNLYYHTNIVHNWYKALDPGMTGLDYAVPANARIADTHDNAYWDGYGINFGGGTADFHNFALFSNIIYHEYSHGVTQWIYWGVPFPYSGETGAMNEAFSDYCAVTILDDPRIGYLTPTSGGMFRTLDNNYVYPDDITGEVHADGRIIGGALWDLRETVERHSVADTLWHFTRYLHPQSFDEFCMDMLAVDDDNSDLTDGTPHHNEILNSFGMHGIGPGRYPQIALSFTASDTGSGGDGDGLIEPGETALLFPSVTNLYDVPLPTIANPRVVFSTNDTFVSFVDSMSILSDIPSSATRQGTPVRITVRSGTPPHFMRIYGRLIAANATDEPVDSFDLQIGAPAVLLVDDSHTAGLADWYEQALYDVPTTYETFDTDSGTPAAAEMLGYDAVIWFTGNDDTTLSLAEQAVITDYLNEGGALVLSGQNIGREIGYSPFYSDYLRSDFTVDREPYLLADGVDGDPVSDGVSLQLIGSPGAGNQYSPDGISALSGTAPILYYPTGDCAGVRVDDGYIAFYFPFSLEALTPVGGHTDLTTFLCRILSYIGIYTGVPEASGGYLPNEIGIVAYPNPFNSSVKITVGQTFLSVQNGQTGMSDLPVTIEIYDLRGNVVKCLNHGLNGLNGLHGFPISRTQNGTFIWTPDKLVASGIYLIRATMADGQPAEKRIIYLK